MSIRSSCVLALLLVLSLCGAAAQEPEESREQQSVPEATALPAVQAADETLTVPAAYALRVGAGDLLEVKVYGLPELDSKIRVNSRGSITLPLIGMVDVEGLTIEEAEDLVEHKYVEGQFLNSPHVTLFVTEYATQGVSVMGEVDKPGVYPVYGPRNLFDVISAAGGTTEKAGRFVDISRRVGNQPPLRVEFSNDPLKVLESNVPVYPGDTVVVSKAGLVYVVGDVYKPGGFVMENNESITVLQAIALAQGTNKTAALKRAKLIRRDPNGTPVEIPIALDKILAAKSEDMKLQSDDIVFVPFSAGKHVALRSLEAVIQTATGIAIYRR